MVSENIIELIAKIATPTIIVISALIWHFGMVKTKKALITTREKIIHEGALFFFMYVILPIIASLGIIDIIKQSFSIEEIIISWSLIILFYLIYLTIDKERITKKAIIITTKEKINLKGALFFFMYVIASSAIIDIIKKSFSIEEIIISWSLWSLIIFYLIISIIIDKEKITKKAPTRLIKLINKIEKPIKKKNIKVIILMYFFSVNIFLIQKHLSLGLFSILLTLGLLTLFAKQESEEENEEVKATIKLVNNKKIEGKLIKIRKDFVEIEDKKGKRKHINNNQIILIEEENIKKKK